MVILEVVPETTKLDLFVKDKETDKPTENAGFDFSPSAPARLKELFRLIASFSWIRFFENAALIP